MVLRALMADLDRTHQTGQSAGGGPVEPVAQAVQYAGAEGIAATGRIDRLFDRDARNVDALAGRMDFGAQFATRDDQCGDARRDLSASDKPVRSISNSAS